MKIRQNKWLAVTAAAAAVGALGLGGVAQADPANPSQPPTYRKLQGVGSDTTEEVMNGLADAITISGQKVLASWNANGGAFDSRDPAALPATATTCNYAAYAGSNGAGIRANGSGAGRDRLLETLTAGNARQGCLDFGRSSSLNQNPAATQLTYIPFALDGMSYAVRSDSTISRTLTLASLKTIYQCSGGPNFVPLLPQSGSGTRSFWLSVLGLTEATKGACVRDTWVDPADGLTKPIQEHDGRVLLDKKEIVPFSAGQFAAQSAGTAVDKRARAVLANIGGIPALGVNGAGLATRKLYNVIPTGRVGDTANYPELNTVFVGPTSLICANGAVIGKYGFGTIADCGDTSKTTS